MLSFENEPSYLTRYRQLVYSGRSVMRDLVDRGYVVICIDAMNFGMRTADAAESPQGFDKMRRRFDETQARKFSMKVSDEEEPYMVRGVMNVGRSWAGLIIADDRRTVDYLCSRSEVDQSRIGCIGHSFGAYRAQHLAAVDPRVKAAVSVCWTATVGDVISRNQYAFNWFTLVPGLFDLMDVPDLQTLIVPRAFLSISGIHDTMFSSAGIRHAHGKLRLGYERCGCSEQLGSLIYDAPHEFNEGMQEEALEWLAEKL